MIPCNDLVMLETCEFPRRNLKNSYFVSARDRGFRLKYRDFEVEALAFTLILKNKSRESCSGNCGIVAKLDWNIQKMPKARELFFFGCCGKVPTNSQSTQAKTLKTSPRTSGLMCLNRSPRLAKGLAFPSSKAYRKP